MHDVTARHDTSCYCKQEERLDFLPVLGTVDYVFV